MFSLIRYILNIWKKSLTETHITMSDLVRSKWARIPAAWWRDERDRVLTGPTRRPLKKDSRIAALQSEVARHSLRNGA